MLNGCATSRAIPKPSSAMRSARSGIAELPLTVGKVDATEDAHVEPVAFGMVATTVIANLQALLVPVAGHLEIAKMEMKRPGKMVGLDECSRIFDPSCQLDRLVCQLLALAKICTHLIDICGSRIAVKRSASLRSSRLSFLGSQIHGLTLGETQNPLWRTAARPMQAGATAPIAIVTYQRESVARLASPDRKCAIASTFAERPTARRPARSQ